MKLTNLINCSTELRSSGTNARYLQANGRRNCADPPYDVCTAGNRPQPRSDGRSGAVEDIALSPTHTRSLADEGDARPSAGMMAQTNKAADRTEFALLAGPPEQHAT